MTMNKPHLEFLRVDMNEGWASPPGYPAGIQQKILTSDLDEEDKRAAAPGCCVSRPANTPPHRSSTTIGKKST